MLAGLMQIGLGFLRAGAAQFAGQVPLILKLNNRETLHADTDPVSVQTGSVDEALGLVKIPPRELISHGPANPEVQVALPI